MAIVVPFNLSAQASVITSITCLFDPEPPFQYVVTTTGDYVITTPANLVRDTTVASAGYPFSNSTIVPLPAHTYTFNPPSLVYGTPATQDVYSVVMINMALAQVEPGFSRLEIQYQDVNNVSHTEYFDCPFWEGWDATARELNNIISYVESRSSFLQKEVDQLTSEMNWSLSRELVRGTMVSGQLQIAPATQGLVNGPLSNVVSKDEKSVSWIYSTGGGNVDPSQMYYAVGSAGSGGLAKTPNGNFYYGYFDNLSGNSNSKGSMYLGENTDGTITMMFFTSTDIESACVTDYWQAGWNSLSPSGAHLDKSTTGASAGDTLLFSTSGAHYGYGPAQIPNSYALNASYSSFYSSGASSGSFQSGLAPMFVVNDTVLLPQYESESGSAGVNVHVFRCVFTPTYSGGTKGVFVPVPALHHYVNFSSSNFNGYSTPANWFGPSGASVNGITLLSGGPTVTGVSPSTACIGNTVTVTGTNFKSIDSAYIGDFTHPASVQFVNATQLVVTIPQNAPLGAQKLIISDGTNSSSFGITVTGQPVVTSISNNNTGIINTACYGDTITINGSAFGSSQGNNSVLFVNSTQSISSTPTSWSDSAIVVPVPRGVVPGSWSVRVSSNCGVATATFNCPAPAITSAFPACPGAAFTVTGTNLTPDATIYISSPHTQAVTTTVASRVSGNSWTMQAKVPVSFSGGAGAYTLTVQYDSYTTPTAQFNYTIPANCVPNGSYTCTISSNSGSMCTTDQNPLHVLFNTTDVTIDSATQIFVTDHNNNPVYGVINSSGVFHCSTPGSYTLYANHAGVYSNTITIVVNNCAPTNVQLTAPMYQVCAGTNVQLDAVVPQTNTDVTNQVTWSGPTGVISASGVFNEATPGTYTIYCTYPNGGNPLISNSITMYVTDCTVQSIVISPSVSNLTAAQNQQFTALLVRPGQGTVDITSQCNWYVNNIAGGNSTNGSITTGGTYSSPQVVTANSSVDVMATYTATNGQTLVGHATAALTVSGGPQAKITVASQINVFLGDGRSGYIPVGSQLMANPGDYVYVMFNETLDYPNRLPIASNTDVQLLTMFNHSAVASDIGSIIYNYANQQINPDLTISTYRTIVLGLIDPSDGRFHSMWDIANSIPGNPNSGQHDLPELASKNLPDTVSLLTNIAGIKGLGDTNWATIGNVIIAWGETKFLGVSKGRIEKQQLRYPIEFNTSCTVIPSVVGKGKYVTSIGPSSLEAFDLYVANMDAQKADITVAWFAIGV